MVDFQLKQLQIRSEGFDWNQAYVFVVEVQGELNTYCCYTEGVVVGSVLLVVGHSVIFSVLKSGESLGKKGLVLSSITISSSFGGFLWYSILDMSRQNFTWGC